MDPNETLARIRELCKPAMTRHHYDELAELVEALDAWMSHGGFPPDAWGTYMEDEEEK